MAHFTRVLAVLSAVAAFSAQAADVTGTWTAKVPTADGESDYTFAFRQSGAALIGTARSEQGVVAVANGSINHNAIAFVENVTVAGRRIVIEYTGEVVSDNEIRFKRQAIAPPYFTVQFVATRTDAP
jgi:hypothetical protein